MSANEVTVVPVQWEEVSPGCWVVKSEPEPTPVEKESVRSRSDVATSLARIGVSVDTSIVSAAEKAQEREQKQQAHEDLLQKIKDKREAELEAEAKTELETLLPIRHGRVDNRFLEILRRIWARNRADGSINYRATVTERKKYLDEYQWRIEHNLPTTAEGV